MCRVCRVVSDLLGTIRGVRIVEDHRAGVDVGTIGYTHWNCGEWEVHVDPRLSMMSACVRNGVILHELLHVMLDHFERMTWDGRRVISLPYGVMVCDAELHDLMERIEPGIVARMEDEVRHVMNLPGVQLVTYGSMGLPGGLSCEMAVWAIEQLKKRVEGISCGFERGGSGRGSESESGNDGDEVDELRRRIVRDGMKRVVERAVEESESERGPLAGKGQGDELVYRGEDPAPWYRAIMLVALGPQVAGGRTVVLLDRLVREGRLRGRWWVVQPDFVAKDYLFVVDVSGSMQGNIVLSQVCRALDQISKLHKVCVVTMSDGVVRSVVWRPGMSLSVDWGGTDIEQMGRVADGVKADVKVLVSDLLDSRLNVERGWGSFHWIVTDSFVKDRVVHWRGDGVYVFRGGLR